MQDFQGPGIVIWVSVIYLWNTLHFLFQKRPKKEKIGQKFQISFLWNGENQEHTGEEVWFEQSHRGILSTDSKVRAAFDHFFFPSAIWERRDWMFNYYL